MRWNFETCRKEALKYEYKKDFRKESRGAYIYASKNKIIDEICCHMKVLGNHYKRCVYAYEFSDKNVYIGITFHLKRRNTEHRYKDDSPVFNHITQTGLEPTLIQLTDYIEKEKAIVIEDEKIKEYKQKGFIILNTAKAGALGGNIIKWTKEKCVEFANTCKTTSEFKKNFPHVYDACIRNKWLREVCNHMEMCKPDHYWTKELCLQEAIKYKTKKDFQGKSNAAFVAARRNNWLEEITTHMERLIKPKGYWNKARCAEEAIKYTKRKEFSIKSGSAYVNARINGWLDEICEHMKK